MTKNERQSAYQTAAHAAALKAAKELVARLEAEGPATGWNNDNQTTAFRILEIEGREEEAKIVGQDLNVILHLG